MGRGLERCEVSGGEGVVVPCEEQNGPDAPRLLKRADSGYQRGQSPQIVSVVFGVAAARRERSVKRQLEIPINDN